MSPRKIMIILAGLCLAAAPAHAYIGPGGGMSAIGALLALAAGVLVAFFGFLWYPIKRFRARRHRQSPEGGPPPHGRVNPPQ